MAISHRDIEDGARTGAATLRARAAKADARADRRLAIAIDDFFLSDDGRLDDQLRDGLAQALSGLVGTIEAAIRAHAGRLLVARGGPALTEAPLALDRLVAVGLVRDSELMGELIGRVRQTQLAEALPVESPDRADQPSMLARLSQYPDHVVATNAVALLAAEGRRREPGAGTRTDLPAELHHRLVWWVAAALRDSAGDATDTLDRALAEAALRSVAAHDESERLEASAMRLAAALDPRADELAPLLIEALADRRLSLFIALLGHALGLDYADARDVVLDPDADRLWLVLRALELDRIAIAKIGLALSDADPRRDVERFADSLDGIAAVPPVEARSAIAPLLLHPDYRAALLALARGARA
jgi:hypothetical protein